MSGDLERARREYTFRRLSRNAPCGSSTAQHEAGVADMDKACELTRRATARSPGVTLCERA